MEITEETKLSKEVKALCPYCGATIPEEERFCPVCGYEKDSLISTSLPSEKVAVAKLIVGDEEFELYEGDAVIGRTDGDIVIKNPYLSRSHAKIGVRGGKLFVVDLGSTNGTFVNGTRITPNEEVQIEPSTELKLGELIVTIRWLAERESKEEQTAPPVASQEEASIGEEGSATPEGAEGAETSLAEVSSSWEIVVGDKKYPLPFGQVRVGRKPERNDISFPDDRYVSGEHLLLEVDLDELKVKDLGSTNGTFINGQRIEAGPFIALADGDEITIGKTVLRIGRTAPAVERVGEEDALPELPKEEKPAESPGVTLPSEAEGLEEKEEDAQVQD